MTASSRARPISCATVAILVGGARAGCSGGPGGAAAPTTAANRAAGPARSARRPAVALRVTQTAALAGPVQLPGLAHAGGGRIVAVGGLDAADASTDAVADGDGVVVVGGRDRRGRVHAERWTLRPA